MAVFKIHAHLIDGSFTESFRSMKAVAAYVMQHLDFGSDSRRSWGIQGEFGTRTFDGFTWEDVTAAVAKMPKPVRVLESTTSGYEWDYESGRGVCLWTSRHVVWVGDSPFNIDSKPGLFRVTFTEFSGPEDSHVGFIGQYRSLAAAVAACQRYESAKPAPFDNGIFQPILTLAPMASGNVPF